MTFDRFINNVHFVAYWLMWTNVAAYIIFVGIASCKDYGSEEWCKALAPASKALRWLVIFTIAWWVTK